MRRLFTMLLAVIVAMAAALIPVTPAHAFGAEQFGCRIAPGTEFNFYENCNNLTNGAANTYSVGFLVQNLSGSGYGFTWNVTGQYTAVLSGCTSTSSSCTVSARGGSVDREITAAVTITQAGQSRTLFSYASILAWCGYLFC